MIRRHQRPTARWKAATASVKNSISARKTPADTRPHSPAEFFSGEPLGKVILEQAANEAFRAAPTQAEGEQVHAHQDGGRPEDDPDPLACRGAASRCLEIPNVDDQENARDDAYHRNKKTNSNVEGLHHSSPERTEQRSFSWSSSSSVSTAFAKSLTMALRETMKCLAPRLG